MSSYTRAEARQWARDNLVGAVNCTIPSFTNDLRAINEKGIRHDVRLAKAHGFLGTLGVSEVSITLPEYLEFLRIAKDEAGEDFYVVHHASWTTWNRTSRRFVAPRKRGRTWSSWPTRRTSTRSRSRRSTTTPRPSATRRTSGSSCSR